MKKTNKQLEDRARYVSQRVNSAQDSAQEIKKLARELFLSERTIERDLMRV